MLHYIITQSCTVHAMGLVATQPKGYPPEGGFKDVINYILYLILPYITPLSLSLSLERVTQT